MKFTWKWKHWHLPALLSLLWCILLLALYQRELTGKEEHTHDMALMQARTLFMQIVDTRAWNAAHGGVYVPESAYGQPNPWIPEAQRSLDAADGRRLVLINPAYMSRQIGEQSTLQGASFRITSNTPLRPENSSDAWETKALNSCVLGESEVFSLEGGTAPTRFRYLAPLRTEQDCLNCHKNDVVGAVRGGISVSLDAQPFLEGARDQEKGLTLAYGLLGFTGVGSICGAGVLLRRKRVLQREREHMKSAFLANMSHDMRTPLTGILGMAEVLANESDARKRTQALQYLTLAGGALLEMVNDITDYAALDSGHMQFIRRRFCVRDVLASCLALFQPQCAAKGLTLSLYITPDVPADVYGDDFRLRQALGNLIGNSVKFTQTGSIDVTVDRPEAEGTHGPDSEMLLRFTVRDTGIGILPEERQRIFERFERGQAAQQKSLSGTGLGLSIALDIVRLMGGSLDMISHPGQGSCFSFTASVGLCPQRDASTPADCASLAKECDSALNGARVLLAEDNTVSAHFMEHILSAAGGQVRRVADGYSALNALISEPTDIAVLDVRMPGLDGLEVARRIRGASGQAYASMPIVVLSASISAAEHAAFQRLHVHAHLLKPVSGAELVRTVCAALGRAEHDNAQDSSTPTSDDPKMYDSPPIDADIFDIAGALAHTDDDPALLRTLCRLWLDEAPRQMQALTNAMDAHNTGAVRLIAHAYKNSSGALHLKKVRAACATLENAKPDAWPALLHTLTQENANSLEALRMYLAGRPQPTHNATT